MATTLPIKRILTFAAAAAIVLPATAAAEPKPGPAPFGTLDRAGGVSNLGLSTGVLLGRSEDPVTGEDEISTALRLDLWGQYVHDIGLGFMVQMPFNFLFEDEADPGIGNLELGAMYVGRFREIDKLILRVAVGVPTASDDPPRVLSNIAGTFARLTDFSLILPNTMMRAGGAYVAHWGPWLMRVDLGFDFDLQGDYDPLFRANLGGGVRLGEVIVILGEVVNLVGFGNFDQNFGDHSIHSLALTMGAASGFLSGSFIVPFEDGITGDVYGLMLRGAWTF